MKKKIAIIGANKPLIPFFKQTNKLGYEIHCFAWDEGAVCKKYADYFYPISFTEKDKILHECEKIGIHGITSFSLESALPTVNFISERMKLEGNPEECGTLTANKFTMREQLGKYGVNVPKYICISSEKDLQSYDHKFPLIVKPIDNGGSRGVTKVINIKELENAFNRALIFSKSGKVLVEQFIEGREFSVEYISHHGQHYFIALTDKVTTGEPYFVELEHHQPALLSTEIANKIKAVTEQTLNALKIYSSASHTEIKMDNEGKLFIIELGPRMGGDRITSDLVRLSRGYDFVKGVLELATGDFTIPQFPISKFSGIYFLSEESRIVYNYIVDPDPYPIIIEKEIYTQKIKNSKESSDRAGFFIYQADNKFNIRN